MSAQMKQLLKERNLDVDKTALYLGIKQEMLVGLNDREIMEAMMREARARVADRDAELFYVILRESLKDCPKEEMNAEQFNERQHWR